MNEGQLGASIVGSIHQSVNDTVLLSPDQLTQPFYIEGLDPERINVFGWDNSLVRGDISVADFVFSVRTVFDPAERIALVHFELAPRSRGEAIVLRKKYLWFFKGFPWVDGVLLTP